MVHRLILLCGFTLSFKQSASDVFRVEAEQFANVVEGKNPLLVPTVEPLFHFIEPAFALRIVRPIVFAVFLNSVFENRCKERFFGFEVLAAAKRIQVLRPAKALSVIIGKAFSAIEAPSECAAS